MQQQQLSYQEFVGIACGHTAFQLLWAGKELGVFELLQREPGLSEQQVGERLGLAPRPARILVTGLRGLRLLVAEGEALSNAEVVAEMLVEGRPGNWVDVLGWQRHIVYPAEVDFVQSLREDRNCGLRHFPGDEANLYDRLAHDSALEQTFHDAMSALSRSANQLLIEQLDLSGASHLVDAGGGDGTNAIALARAFPQLAVTVFDRPSVCRRAAENCARVPEKGRLRTAAGDLFSSDFPAGADAILLAHMLTIWSPEQNVALLRRAYRALPPGGRVIVFNMMADDDGSGPISAALGSPYFLSIATGEGMLYRWSEYEGFLREAGFSGLERHRLPKDHGVIVGFKQSV